MPPLIDDNLDGELTWHADSIE